MQLEHSTVHFAIQEITPSFVRVGGEYLSLRLLANRLERHLRVVLERI